MKKLTEGKPLKVILLFAIPMFIGQLFQLFYSLVDTRIVGEYLGKPALAAVGATTTLSDFLNGLLFGMTNGFAIVIATFFGAKDEKNMKRASFGSIVIGGGSSLLISILCITFLDQLMGLLRVDKAMVPMAKEYIGIILIGLSLNTMYNVGASTLRAVGDSFTPLIFLIVASLLNIGGDLLFVRVFHMGVKGAALSTVISQGVAAVTCLAYMFIKYPALRIGSEDRVMDRMILRRLLPTGLSMAFMVSFVNLGTLALQTAINTFSDDIIVSHMASRKVSSIFMMPFGILGTALATYCGQNLGAGKYNRIRTGMRDTLFATFVWCTGVIIVAYTVAPQLVKLITSVEDPYILETSTKYLKINTILYYVCAVICLTRNSMQGFGDSRTPVISSVLEFAMKMIAAFVMAPGLGYFGVMIAEPISWVVMVIPLVIGCLRNPILRQQDEEISI